MANPVGKIMIFKVVNYSLNPELSAFRGENHVKNRVTATSQAPGVWDNIPDVLDTSGPEASDTDHPHGPGFHKLGYPHSWMVYSGKYR